MPEHFPPLSRILIIAFDPFSVIFNKFNKFRNEIYVNYQIHSFKKNIILNIKFCNNVKVYLTVDNGKWKLKKIVFAIEPWKLIGGCERSFFKWKTGPTFPKLVVWFTNLPRFRDLFNISTFDSSQHPQINKVCKTIKKK